jgi:hypothetical protein
MIRVDADGVEEDWHSLSFLKIIFRLTIHIQK